jgi:hypothetical protein
MALQGKTTVIKRGNTSDNNLLLGAKGEIVVNETTKSLRVHTGTRGGTELLRADMANLDTGVSSVIDFNGARLRDIGSPVASTDAATKAYVDAHGGGGGGSSTLEGLSDVALGTLSTGQVLKYDGSAWINSSLGTSAVLDVGTTANKVVQLNGSGQLPAVSGALLTGITGSQVSGVLLAENNLTDLEDIGTAVLNLGLGSAAVKNTGTSNGQVPLAENVALLSEGKISSEVLPTGVLTSTDKNIANGVAGLDGDGLIPANILPNISITNVTSGPIADLPAPSNDNIGDVYITTDTSQTFISDGSSWNEILNINSASISDLIVDMENLKGAIGDIVNVDTGEWDGFTIGTTNYLGSTTSLKDALDILDNEIYTIGGSLVTTLGGLSDVQLSGTISSGEVLKYNGTKWVDSSLSTSDLSNSAEIPLLVGGTITASLDGNALTSSSWLSAITLSLSGTIITGSVNIDGSGNVDLLYDVTPSSITGGMIASSTVTNNNLQNSSIYIGSHTLSLGGTLNLSGLTVSGSTLSVNQISLDGLSDVVITSPPSNNQVLKYDTGTSKWVNGSATGSVSSLNDLTDVSIDSGALVAGQSLRYNGAVFLNTKLASSDLNDTTSIMYKIDNLSGLYDITEARSNIGASSQTEVNNIESSIGGFVDANGVWVTGGGITTNYLSSATSLTDALDILDNQISIVNGNIVSTLDGLSDVTLGTLSTGQVLKYNGSVWINDNAGGGGGDVYLANANTFTNTNTFNGSYLLVESLSGEDKFKVDNVADTIDMFTPITLVDDAYIYVKFDGMSSMNDFFYVFTSPDNGVTRQVVPLTLIQDSGTHYLQKITSWSMGGSYTFDYSVYSANGFMQYTNPSNVPNASFKRDPNLTYYISSWNRNQTSDPDFGLAISDSNDGLGLSYVDLAGSGFDSNVVETIYEIIANVPTVDTLTASTYIYDRRTIKVANFDKASDLTTLARLEVAGIAEVGKLIVNGSTTLGGAIDLGSTATATTPSANDNTTKVATTAYVQTELSDITLNNLSDVTVSAPATGQTIRYNGSAFVNSKLSFSDLSSTDDAALLNDDNNFTGNIKFYGGNLNVFNGKNQTYYLFVKYNSTSRNDLEYFYVFTSSDGGLTRESVPLTLLQDGGTDYLEEDNSQGYKRYIASQVGAYTNIGTVANAAMVLDLSKTYYFTIRTDNDNTTPNLDFQIYISDNINALGFTYNNVLPYGGGFFSDDNPYTITINSSAWSEISLSQPTGVSDATGLLDSPEVLSIDNDTGNIVSNGYIQLKEQGSVPTPVSSHAQIYAKVDVSDTEIYVQDSAGNNTKLSPHNEEGEWEYYSYNKRTGKSIRINMEKMIRTLEALTGEKFIIEE